MPATDHGLTRAMHQSLQSCAVLSPGQSAYLVQDPRPGQILATSTSQQVAVFTPSCKHLHQGLKARGGSPPPKCSAASHSHHQRVMGSVLLRVVSPRFSTVHSMTTQPRFIREVEDAGDADSRAAEPTKAAREARPTQPDDVYAKGRMILLQGRHRGVPVRAMPAQYQRPAGSVADRRGRYRTEPPPGATQRGPQRRSTEVGCLGQRRTGVHAELFIEPTAHLFPVQLSAHFPI